ncbi:MAG: hypothetical protein WC975_08640 [Phycisphaerae bacterium]
MDYSIKKDLVHGEFVVYQCPSCQGQLESPLKDAGTNDTCPMCQKSFTVPGIKELNAKKTEEQARQAREKARVEERERLRIQYEKEREAQKLLGVKEKAEKNLIQNQHQQQMDVTAYESLMTTTTADRVLRFSFKFAKWVSAFIVLACLVTAIGCLIGLLIVYPDIKPIESIQPFDPTFASWKLEFEPEEQAQNNPQQDASVPQISSQETSVSPAYVGRLKDLTKKYNLSEYGEEYPENQSIWVANFISEIDEKHRDQFVSGLGNFLMEFSQHVLSKGKAKNYPCRVAAEWYKKQFIRSIEKNQELRNERREKNIAEEQAASANRRILGLTLVGAITALMVFLFLPLMIQIEHNTRVLLADRRDDVKHLR